MQHNSGYKDANFKETILSELVEKVTSFLNFLTKKKLKYFSNNFRKVTNLGILYLFPKIYKYLNVSGRPVIFNCGEVTVKASGILDFLS